MRVFVTGASGFIGSAVAAELRDAGHEVTGLARSPAAADRLTALGAGVTLATLADTGRLQAAAASDGVIHLAYRHGEPPEAAATTDRQVIETLGDALAGSGKPLVVTSGTLVLPAGRVGTESDAPDPAAPAAARAAGERAVLHGVGEQGVRLRAVAELIAARLGVPVRQVPADQAGAYFGWLATLAGTDAPASSAATQSLLTWEPACPGLLDDLADGEFFPGAQRRSVSAIGLHAQNIRRSARPASRPVAVRAVPERVVLDVVIAAAMGLRLAGRAGDEIGSWPVAGPGSVA